MAPKSYSVEAKGDHFEHKYFRLVHSDRLHECFKFCIKNLSGINDFTLGHRVYYYY